jgi:hypothetical protein
MNGRPLDIGWASAHVPAILETRHQGIRDGNAVAQGRRYWNKESKRYLLTDGK